MQISAMMIYLFSSKRFNLAHNWQRQLIVVEQWRVEGDDRSTGNVDQNEYDENDPVEDVRDETPLVGDLVLCLNGPVVVRDERDVVDHSTEHVHVHSS